MPVYCDDGQLTHSCRNRCCDEVSGPSGGNRYYGNKIYVEDYGNARDTLVNYHEHDGLYYDCNKDCIIEEEKKCSGCVVLDNNNRDVYCDNDGQLTHGCRNRCCERNLLFQ